jgi:hypothetical protein
LKKSRNVPAPALGCPNFRFSQSPSCLRSKVFGLHSPLESTLDPRPPPKVSDLQSQPFPISPMPSTLDIRPSTPK